MEFDIDSIVKDMDFTGGQFVTCKNGLMLTNGEISVLKRFGINTEEFNWLLEFD